jgi:hypothetical protein
MLGITPQGPHGLRPYSAYRQRIKTYLCPSDGSSERGGWDVNTAAINYAVNVGDSTVGPNEWYSGNVSNVSTQFPRGVFGFRAGTKMADITDGTSNTLAFSEIVAYSPTNHGKIKGHYVMIGASQLRNSPIVCMQAKGPNGILVGNLPPSHHRHGESWASGYPMIMGFTTILPPNSPSCANANGEWQEGIFPPMSQHPNGVMAAMSDGSVRFVQDNINSGNITLPVPQHPNFAGMSPYGVWGAMGTKSSGEALQAQ